MCNGIAAAKRHRRELAGEGLLTSRRQGYAAVLTSPPQACAAGRPRAQACSPHARGSRAAATYNTPCCPRLQPLTRGAQSCGTRVNRSAGALPRDSARTFGSDRRVLGGTHALPQVLPSDRTCWSSCAASSCSSTTSPPATSSSAISSGLSTETRGTPHRAMSRLRKLGAVECNRTVDSASRRPHTPCAGSAGLRS